MIHSVSLLNKVSLMQLSNSIAFSKRGDCTFTAKAEVAQLGGAAGLLIMNDNEGSHLPRKLNRQLAAKIVLFTRFINFFFLLWFYLFHFYFYGL